MPDKRIGILLEADADTSAFEEEAAAIDDFSKAGIKSMEKLQDKVFDLQRAVVEQKKALNANRQEQAALNAEIAKAGVATEAQTNKVKLLATEESKLAGAVKLSSAQYKTTAMDFKNLSARTSDAVGDAQSLAGVLGVQLPSALTNLVSRSALVQKAMGTIIPSALVGAGIAGIVVGVAQMFESIYHEYNDFQQRVAMGGSIPEILSGSRRDALDAQASHRNDLAEAAIQFARNAQRTAALTPLLGTQRNDQALQYQIEDLKRSMPSGPLLAGAISAASLQTISANTELTRAAGERVKQLSAQTGQLGMTTIAATLAAAEEQVRQLQEKAARGEVVGAGEIDAIRQAAKAKNDLLIRDAAHAAEQATGQANLLGMTSVDAATEAAALQVDDLAWNSLYKTGIDSTAQQLAALKKARFQVQQIKKQVNDEVLSASNQSRLAGLSGTDKIYASAAIDNQNFSAKAAEQLGFGGSADAAARFAAARNAQAAKEAEDLYKQHQEAITQLQDEANLSRLNGVQQTLAQINSEEQKSVREYQKLLADKNITEQQFADARVAIETIAERRKLDAVKSFGREIESLYDRTIGSAHTFGEAMKNIWGEVMAYWKHQAFDAFAAIILGQQQVLRGGGGGQPGGGAGGILGTLGGIFGGGGGMGTPATPGTFPSGVGGSGFMSGSSGLYQVGTPWGFPTGSGGGGIGGGIGGGWGLPGGAIPAGMPGSSGGGSTGLTKLLGQINPKVFESLGLMGGMALGNKFSNPFARAGAVFGGIAGGAAALGAYMGIAGGIGAGSGALTGLGLFFTNPWTILPAIAIAAIFGLSGLLGNGQKKVDASKIADDGFAQIKQAVADYKAFRTDYPTTTTNMAAIWSQMVNGWNQIGGSVGANSIKDQTKYYQGYLDQVNAIRDSRTMRTGYAGSAIAALPTGINLSPVKGLPVPEFAMGGYTGYGSDGTGRPAILHDNEFVFNRSAVQRYGRETLERMNNGTDGGGAVGTAVLVDIGDVIAKDPAAFDRGVLVWLQRKGKAAKVVLG